MISVVFRYFGITSLIFWTQYPRFARCDAPMLTCDETVLVPLSLVPMRCIKGGSDGLPNFFTCSKMHRSKRDVVWSLEMQLGVPSSDLSNNQDSFIEDWGCISIFLMSGTTDRFENHFSLEFNVSHHRKALYIGIEKYICDNVNGRNCSLEVKMRDDVLALPPFSFTPDEPEFWNFSSPLFRPELLWLSSLHLTGSLTYHYPFVLPGLAGSSIRELCVNGSFGTDQRGALPHLDNLPMLNTLIVINSSMDLALENVSETVNIKDLKILQNNFSKIPKIIAELIKLEELTFESTMKNFTFSPEPSVLHVLNNLESLILSGSYIEQWTMPYLPNLFELRLCRCKMKRFSAAKEYNYLQGLQLLFLGENFLSSLSSDAFTGVPNLHTLDLSYNSIIQLSSHMFTSLHRLTDIFLQGNNLTNWPVLPRNIFISIDVSHNSLSNLINLGLHINYVNNINISNNSIVSWDNANIFMEETTSDVLSELVGFSIRDMNISIPNPADAELQTWAYQVNLSNNYITLFSPAMLSSLSILNEVDLGGNMINCGDCKTSDLQQWLASTTVTVKNLGQHTPLTCHQPAQFKDRPIQDVNFSEECFIPRRYLWVGIGAPIAGLIAFVAIGGVIFYYRTEVVYLAHLAKIRAKSKRKTQARSNACYDAFICYSGRNRKWVIRRLAPLLERRPESYLLCLFDRDFRLGTHIVTNIVDAIEHSRKIIVVLTQHFIDSKWCQWELEMAQHKLFSEDREFLVLLELEPLERRRLPRLLRFLLDTRLVVRWPRPETAPAVMAAAAELRAVLGPSLRQTLLADPPTGDEPRPSTSRADEQTSLLGDV